MQEGNAGGFVREDGQTPGLTFIGVLDVTETCRIAYDAI